METASKLKSAIADQATERLQSLAKSLAIFSGETDEDFNAGTAVLMEILGELETRMPEAEYIAFCDAILST